MATGETNPIDWDEVKQRLHESQLALEKSLDADPSRVEVILRQRAVQLAGRQTQEAAPASSLRVLVFMLGTERYALPFADLQEILPYVACTPVPTGPSELIGVVNIGGEIRSVLDLGRMLGFPSIDADVKGYLLLVCFEGRKTALRVDGLEKSQWIAPEELVSLNDEAATSGSRYVVGLGPNKVRVLDIRTLLEHPVFSQKSQSEVR